LPPRLIAYGDVLVDIVVQIGDFPQPGQDAIVQHASFLPGGSAANCAVTAIRLGVYAKLVGLIGNDLFGNMLRDALAREGLDLTALRHVDAPTAVVISIVDGTSERTLLSFRGAAAAVPYGQASRQLMLAGDCLHVSGYSFQTPYSRETANDLMAEAKKVGALLSLDPSFHFARRVIADYPEVLAGLDFFFPNQQEALLITGTERSAEAARRLCDLGIKTVVIKSGAAGCHILSGLLEMAVPAYPALVVDTTGAGDAFCGGFLAAVLKGCTLEQAAHVGNAAAALVIARPGGHTGSPTILQVQAFAAERDDAMLQDAVTCMIENSTRR
jgi:sugar/nucleoside kinase (ribokinase family)